MTIFDKNTSVPTRQNKKHLSLYVFIYYKNNRRFCIGYYDHAVHQWFDSDGMIIDGDFLWCYLPVKQFKAYINTVLNKKMDDQF